MSQGARVSDLVRVRPGPVLPAVWLQGREKRQAWRDRSPGPRTLKEGRGSQCDSADNRRASVAPPPASAAGTRQQAPCGGPVPQAPLLHARSEVRAQDAEPRRRAKGKSDCSGSGFGKKRLHVKFPNQRIPNSFNLKFLILVKT